MTKRWLGLIGTTTVLLFVGALVWRYGLMQQRQPAATTNTPSSSSSASSGGQHSNDTPTKGGSGDTTTSGTGTAPEQPSGQFVSNHSPNLSGSPAPNTETSICITTPGAYCTISFTSGSTTKSLPKKRTDSNGTALWENWTLQSVNLTAGTWHVEAVASNGDRIARSADASDLVVSP